MSNEKPTPTSMTMEQLIEQAAQTLPVVSQSKTPLYLEGDNAEVEYRTHRIRRQFHEGEWWFSIVDFVGAMAESVNPRNYWATLKKRIVAESGDTQLLTECQQLKMLAEDMKIRDTDCAAAETLFRIIQSIPSKHAEKIKRWLAKTAYERTLEAQNPEIAIKRAVADYKNMGRDEIWIRRRIEGIISRNQLTTEWNTRGVSEGYEFAALTNEISKGTFGLTTQGHKEHKGLRKRHPLRDHMTGLELALTMIGEEATREIAVNTDAQGYTENHGAAVSGGKIAGNTRREIEAKSGKSALSSSNFLPPGQKKPLLPPPADNEFDDEDPTID